MGKLRNDRGETLVEVLASILIATLSVTLLFGCIVTASGIDVKAKEMDKTHYEDLTNADVKTGETFTSDSDPATTFAVTVARIDSDDPDAAPAAAANLPIEIYGGEGMLSYERSGGTGP